MNLFADTSVWSLAFRRDETGRTAEVQALAGQLEGGGSVFTTGLVLQELLQGFSGPRARDTIVRHFSVLPFVTPDRNDHVAAAELRNRCRRKGVQVGTIDALFAQLCIHHGLTMLTTDRDFARMARHCDLALWKR